MGNRGLYSIPFKGLSLGSHSFDWTIDRDFFTTYEMSEIGDARIDVHVTLVKHTRFLELEFVLNGWAEVSCDRCLDPLKLDIDSDTNLYVKFDDDAGEDDESDVVVVPHEADQLDVSWYIYEYAHLSLPLRKVHPDDQDGNSTCNQEMLRKLEQYLVKDNGENSDSGLNDFDNIFEN